MDYTAESEADIAKILKTKWDLGLSGGVLVGNPVPAEYAQNFDEMEKVIDKALQMADEAGVHGKNITPFLLATIKDLTGGESFKSNVALALNNAKCAAKVAKAYAEMK